MLFYIITLHYKVILKNNIMTKASTYKYILDQSTSFEDDLNLISQMSDMEVESVFECSREEAILYSQDYWN